MASIVLDGCSYTTYFTLEIRSNVKLKFTNSNVKVFAVFLSPSSAPRAFLQQK